MERNILSWWFARRLLGLIAATVLFACGLSIVMTCGQGGQDAGATGDNGSANWTAPPAMTMRKVSTASGPQHTPVLLSNLDCTLLTYRFSDDSTTMHTGCFTETAFGMLDSDSDVAIFNGTDEGVPLTPYAGHQILAPWPKAMDLISLIPTSTVGSVLGMYKNPPAVLQDQRNFLGRLAAKQITASPDMTLKDSSGNLLVVNPQTLAFSDNGSWLVVEALNGSFVRINLASLSITAFAPAYNGLGSQALLKSTVAISEDGRFVAIANKNAAEFKVYDLDSCDGLISNTRPQNCKSYDYWPFAQHQIGGLQLIRRIDFINDGLLRLEVNASPANSGTYELAPAASIASLTGYIGLGDSYTSGEGAFNYLAGTDSPDNMCHLSNNSYPLLLSRDLFGAAGGHSVACSGAVINDIGSTSDTYRGQARGVGNLQELQESQPLVLESIESDFLPGYVAQQRFVKRWQPEFGTVSIGGNDIGFGDLLQNCVEPHVGRHISDNTCYDTYEDRLELMHAIDRTIPRWTALYMQLQREAPATQLYVIGYPQITVDNGKCGLNVQLNKSELEFAGATVDYLDRDIQKAAEAAGIPYVDISQALEGHRLCETASYNVAVNGLTAGTDAGPLSSKVFGKESYHPNALGHQLIEQTILKQTHNLARVVDNGASSTGENSASNTNPPLLNAPKTGRAINVLVPDDNLTPGIGQVGLETIIHANGGTDGLRPYTPYTVHLDGPEGDVLGTLVSDQSGNINGSMTIPTDASSGGHIIDVIGDNQSGEKSDITQPFYIPASDTDSDGDGVDDTLDSCPGAINSGIDDDGDGIDDICDPLIVIGSEKSRPTGEPPLSNGSGQDGRTTTQSLAVLKPHTHVLGAETTIFGRSIQRVADSAHHSIFKPHLKRVFWLFWLAILLSVPLTVLVIKRCVKTGGFDYNDVMIWVRKGFVLFLSLLLLVGLLGAALTTSSNYVVTSPKKVETMLAESKLYDHFVAYVADQAAQSEEGSNQDGSVSLTDAAVQAAAKTSFPSTLIQKGVNSFIDANYVWLEGKTPTPQFTFDLSTQKSNFADRVGQIVKNYSASLPVCTAAQTAQELSVDPLAATCRPAEATPEAIGAQVTQRLSTTGDFLSNPVLTASSVNPKGNTQSRPYFVRFSHLPQAYRASKKLPFVFGGVAILSALGVLFIALTRRRGIRRIGWVLLIAGVVLIANTFATNPAVDKVTRHAFNSNNVGPLQQSLTDFAHRVASAIAGPERLFGIGFLVLAAIIFGALFATRQKTGKPKKQDRSSEAPEQDTGPLPLIKSRNSLRRPFGDSIMPLGAKPGGDKPEPPKSPAAVEKSAGSSTAESSPESAAPTAPELPKRKKRPRLIQ